MKRGFTLVELSIVLVIIGLIIGGILAAQSMVQTAKISNIIRQIQQYDIAYTNFKTKYNQIPGDSTLFSPAGYNTGELQDFRNIGGRGEYFGAGGQLSFFWVHLQQSGEFSYTKTISGNVAVPGGWTIDGASPNSPKIVLDIDSGVVIYTVGGRESYLFGNWKGLGDPTGWFGTAGNNPVLKPATILAIDAKIDDKAATTGNVTATNNGGSCYSGTAYVVSNSAVTCDMHITTLAQVGK